MKTTTILAIILLIGLWSCKKVDEFTQFNLPYNETIVVPASTGISLPFNIFTPDIETNSESTFEVNDTRKDLIEEIVLRELNLTITEPSNGNFQFLKSVDVFLNADGLSELKIAWADTVASDIGKELILKTTTVDLKEYIKKDKFSLRLNTVTSEFLAEDHKIDLAALFFVDA
ncbi:MAG: hypothetical protein AB8B72_11735, partial [Crocinitomicaceae bacterium]